jgi:hypothetical protein
MIILFIEVSPIRQTSLESVNCRAKGIYFRAVSALCLTSPIKMYAAQQERDDQVRKLWSTVASTLDVVKTVQGLSKEPLLDRTVAATMKQVYECALFLRRYSSKSFGGKSCNLRPIIRSSWLFRTFAS